MIEDHSHIRQNEPDYFAPNVTDAREKFGAPTFRMVKGSDTELDRSCGNYIIKGLLDRGDFCATGGPSGAGKTFFCLTMAYALATGSPLLGRRVRQTNVFYLTLEGHAGFKRRVCAYEQSAPDAPFYYNCAKLSDLQNKAFTESMLQTIADYEIGLVCIDTLARFLGEADENANSGMAKAMAFADQINRRSGAASMFIAHSGKDASKGLRGHSSLRGALDLELIVDNSEEDGRTVKLAKVKDGPEGERFAFSLKTVDLGEDDEGDSIRPCVATDPVKIDERREESTLTPTEQKWFDGIQEFFATGGGKPRQVSPHDSRKYVSGQVSEIRACLQRIGVCPGAPDSGDTPETEAERTRRERQNSKDLGKWAGALRSKGKLGYENGLIWLVDGAE